MRVERKALAKSDVRRLDGDAGAHRPYCARPAQGARAGAAAELKAKCSQSKAVLLLR